MKKYTEKNMKGQPFPQEDGVTGRALGGDIRKGNLGGVKRYRRTTDMQEGRDVDKCKQSSQSSDNAYCEKSCMAFKLFTPK